MVTTIPGIFAEQMAVGVVSTSMISDQNIGEGVLALYSIGGVGGYVRECSRYPECGQSK